MTAEQTTVWVTPHGGESGTEPELHPAEMRITELPTGVLVVDDPIHDQPYRIGDRSMITDAEADQYVQSVFKHLGLHFSTRQLSNTEAYSTKKGTGRWSRGQHMLSTAAATAMHGGTALEIMQMATHDIAHRLGSHRTDDLLTTRGLENAHDTALQQFFVRSGFLQSLRSRHRFGRTGSDPGQEGLSLDAIGDLSNLPQGHINWPGKTGYLEQERLQYLLQEAALWIFGPEKAREIRRHVHREPDSELGDHLVFDDADAAYALVQAQTRCYTEHWTDPLNDVIDEALMTADRGVMVSRAPQAAAERQFYPGDILYALEEDWQAVRNTVAEYDPFVAAMLKIAGKLAEQQRDRHLEYQTGFNRYAGPDGPRWVTLQGTILQPSDRDEQRVVLAPSRRQRRDTLVFEMKPGKARAIDPLVRVSVGGLRRISQLRPDIVQYREQQSQWCGMLFDAVVNLSDVSLGLTNAERRSIEPGLERIHAEWPGALLRPHMSDAEFALRVNDANRRYRQIGRLPVAARSLETVRAS